MSEDDTTTPPPLALPDLFVARTPEQARLLLSDTCQQLLARVIRAEASATEAAQAAQITVKQAHHRLSRLVAAGLVQVVGSRPRSGRPVKVYRAVARTYRTPFELTDAATLEDLMGQIFGPFLDTFNERLVRLFVHDDRHELMLTADERGRPTMNLNPQATPRERRDTYGALGSFSRPQLDADTRRELERRLRELNDWVTDQDARQRGGPGAVPCLLGLFFTPERTER
ncbi:hypothetical protein [Deinococcus yunweiensis]|uniref:hypothetical protein n=1 Tax=Deinococcus yunweiensis TaxID=367282 RepID=UPI00398F458F